MSTHSAEGFDPSGQASKVVDGVYTVSQKKGGRIHAFLLDDGGALTLIDTLYDHDGALIVRAIEQLGRNVTDLKNIVLTHAHRSHIGGLAALKKLSGATVWAHEAEADIIAGKRKSPGTTFVPQWPLRVYYIQLGLNIGVDGHAPCQVDRFVREGDSVGPLQIMHAPGHSAGHLAMYWKQRSALFAGDAIATWPELSLGWPGLTLDQDENLHSLRKIDDVRADVIAVGHGEPAMGEQIEHLRGLIRAGRVH
jgi:glyoxylase-like metal-dependent hydrolase (beta-lactamase superfamily II)